MANYKKKAANAVLLADKMRKSVLQAAIEGKLTTQNPAEDGDARDLLAEIQVEKQRLIAAGEIKREKAVPAIDESELPFDIPENWVWVRLNEIVSLLGDGIHGTPDYTIGGEYAFINGNNLNNGEIYLKDNTKYVNKIEFEKYKKNLNEKSVLVSINGTLGNVAFYNNEKVILGKSACYFNLMDGIDKNYIKIIIQSKFFLDYAIKFATGTTIKNVSLKSMREFVLPLPAIAEQQRIVEKLEQILPQLDRLQADENKLHAIQTAFPRRMQASLLQAAIEGKLTTQDPKADGTASELLEQIQAERQRLIDAKEIKREKPLPAITEEEKPFDIPENWEWVKLGDLTFNWGQKLPNNKFTYIDISSINNKLFRLGENMEILEPNQAPSRARKIVKKGDIIYSTVRPYLMNICIIDKDITPEPIVSTGFAVFNTSLDITNKYLFRVLLSPYFDSYANHNDNAKGVAYPAINDTRLKNALIPLPPLAEQERIVAKLDALLPKVQALNDL